MKSVLIIDDSDYKRRDISAVLREMFPAIQIDEAWSYQSGVRKIVKETPELIVLDISIPTFDQSSEERGGTFLNFGGEDILIEMDRIAIRCPVVVVTQFDRFGRESESISLDSLDEKLRKQRRPNYVGAVFYSALENTWKSEFQRLVFKGGRK